MIVDAGIAPRGVVQDLSRVARSSNFAQSAGGRAARPYELGVSAHMRSVRTPNVHRARWWASAATRGPGREQGLLLSPSYFARPRQRVRQLREAPSPTEWILPNYQGITQEAIDYFKPLMAGEPKLIMDGAVPATIIPFNKR